MSNSLDPNQDQRFVGPDLGTNCLQRLSADDKDAASKERVKHFVTSVFLLVILLYSYQSL